MCIYTVVTVLGVMFVGGFWLNAFAFYLAFTSFAWCGMPGKHSPGKLADRLARARKRGYLPRRSADDRRTKAQTSRITPCGDRPLALLPPWGDDGSDAIIPRDAGLSLPRTPVRVDPLQANDPWAHASSKFQDLETKDHVGLWEAWQGMAHRMDPKTPPFVPAIPPLASTCGDASDGRDKELEQSYNLIQHQNDCIALLMAQLSELRASSGPTRLISSGSGDHFDERLEKVIRDVGELTSSLGSAVQDSITRRTLPFEQRLSKLETLGVGSLDAQKLSSLSSGGLVQRLASLEEACSTLSSLPQAFVVINEKMKVLNEHTNEKISVSIRSFAGDLKAELMENHASSSRSLAETFLSSTTSLMRKYDERIQKQLTDMKEKTYQLSTSLSATPSSDLPTPSGGVEVGDGGDLSDREVPAFICGDAVRLQGLKTLSLNGNCGTINGFSENSGRFAVQLVGRAAPKAFLPTNLEVYHTHPEDKCPTCDEFFNLHAFPPCACAEASTKVFSGQECKSTSPNLPTSKSAPH